MKIMLIRIVFFLVCWVTMIYTICILMNQERMFEELNKKLDSIEAALNISSK